GLQDPCRIDLNRHRFMSTERKFSNAPPPLRASFLRDVRAGRIQGNAKQRVIAAYEEICCDRIQARVVYRHDSSAKKEGRERQERFTSAAAPGAHRAEASDVLPLCIPVPRPLDGDCSARGSGAGNMKS